VAPLRPGKRLQARIEREGGVSAAIAVQVIAVSTLVVVFVGALIMWLVDSDNFSNYGVSLWWAIQTVTTVGYGDIVPNTVAGRIVAAVLMLTGIGLITVVSGAVASGLLDTVRRKRGYDSGEQLRAELEAIHRRLDELGAPPRD
jgi:voltage-gated potassium channel